MEDNEKMAHTTTMTVRLPVEVAARLEGLARSTDRTKSFLAGKAIEEYLAAQEWQVHAIEGALQDANAHEARFVDHAYVVSKRLRS